MAMRSPAKTKKQGDREREASKSYVPAAGSVISRVGGLTNIFIKKTNPTNIARRTFTDGRRPATGKKGFDEEYGKVTRPLSKEFMKKQLKEGSTLKLLQKKK